MNEEARFAYRIRQALNEGLEHLDYRTVLRLEQARQAALARHRQVETGKASAPRAGDIGGRTSRLQETPAAGGLWVWVQRLGVAAPLVALLAGFVGIYEWRQQQMMEELAGIDLAVLLDEGPIDAYADQGFGILLDNRHLQ